MLTVSVVPLLEFPPFPSTCTIASPVRLSSATSYTYIFCFPADLNVTPLLNLISPLFSAVNAIAFHGLGILSPKLSESKIIEPR